jgi:hypothetical protein
MAYRFQPTYAEGDRVEFATHFGGDRGKFGRTGVVTKVLHGAGGWQVVLKLAMDDTGERDLAYVGDVRRVEAGR